MSHTFYESPDEVDEGITIDVTPEWCWFFQHVRDSDEGDGYVRVSRKELPAIYKALGVFLKDVEGL